MLKEILRVWFNVISRRSHPCHLVLGLKDEDGWDASTSGLVKWILKSDPPVNILSVHDSGVFSLVYANTPADNQMSQLTLAFQDVVNKNYFEKKSHSKRYFPASRTSSSICPCSPSP
jgi:hypothetical protein